MTDAPVQTAQTFKERPPAEPAPAVPILEAKQAIGKAFPHAGELRIRHLWSADGGSRFRANWFLEQGGQMTVATSLVLGVVRTPAGLQVTDHTIVG